MSIYFLYTDGLFLYHPSKLIYIYIYVCVEIYYILQDANASFYQYIHKAIMYLDICQCDMETPSLNIHNCQIYLLLTGYSMSFAK